MKRLFTLIPSYAPWALLVLIIFTPLWKGGKTLEATWLLAAVAELLVLWTYSKGIDRGEKGEQVPLPVFVLGIAFVLWTILSYATSTTQNYGFDEVLREGSLMLIFFWMIRFRSRIDPQTENRRMTFTDQFTLALLVSACIACVVGVAVYILEPVERFVGTFFDPRFHTDFWPNAWAQFLLLVWPIALSFALRAEAERNRHKPWGFLGFLIGCMLLSFSRGAMIAFSGQLLLLVILASLPHARHASVELRRVGDALLKHIAALSLTLGIALLTFVAANLIRGQIYPVTSVVEKVTFAADEGNTSVNERSAFWSQSFALSLEKPFLGWGPYSFRFIQPRLQEHVLATSDHPHNVFLKLAMERGWIAALLFAALLFTAIVPSLKSYTVSSMSFHSRIEPYALIGIAGVLAHNLIDYNLQFVGIALPFWLMLGLIVKGRGLPLEERTAKSVRTVEIALVSALLLLAVFEGRFLALSSMGRHAEAAGRGEEALLWYDRASMERFSRDMHLSRANLLIIFERFPKAQSALDAYFSMNAEDARAWKLQGDLAMHLNDPGRALSSYERAYEYGKWNRIGALADYMRILEGEPNGLETIQGMRAEIDTLVDEYAKAIVQNTHFIALSPNVEEFLALMTKLEVLFPDDAPRYEVLGARVDRHAKEEREKVKARAPGYLW
ncbi:MAG: O-antigen ligase family protein [Candidatus Peregrinibacteria bacterium]|nr:O-antigen ligase family protein [Candidatus Peregrinibacteria bacterium]